jgi:hypothetical protein
MNEPEVEEGLKDSSGIDNVAYLPYEFPLSEWSSNWLGYSRFDGVLVTADDLRSMPESVRTALWGYVESGGSLLVLGPWEAPRQWRTRRQTAITLKFAEEEESENESESNTPSSVAPARHDLQFFYVGFGVLTTTGAADPKQISAAEWSRMKLFWEGSRSDENYYASISDINREFPVVERIGIPVRGLFALMILFVIVIGPINLIWLARGKKKMWLLWTVPVISLLTCLVISAFALFGEGVSATARTEALTILDETSHRATTVGWMAFYSPITSGGGLHFSPETELMPRLPGWEYGRGGGVGRTLDWTNDQHLGSEWITARVPAYFKFRKGQTRRERLILREQAEDRVSVVNGLGADIRQLWWADERGNIYTATNIPAGAESRLTSVNLQAAGRVDILREVFTDNDWLKQFNIIEVNPRETLAPNSYLAVFDASPFVEDSLGNVKTRKAKTMVYGIRGKE